MAATTERHAGTDELCACGRQAETVFGTEKGEVAYCDDLGCPLVDAREDAALAYFYAGGVCENPDKMIAAIDQATAKLRIARAMLAARGQEAGQ